MESKILFKKIRKLYTDLLAALQKIEENRRDQLIIRCEESIMEIDASLVRLKGMVINHTFSSLADEVHFFKELKPLFIAQFIYHSRILSIEAKKPSAGPYILKEYYEYELRDLKRFTDDFPDFYEYYRRKATYLDQKYFVRQQFDIKAPLDANRYNFDEKFTTSHDGLVAQILAGDRLEKYLLTAAYNQEGHYFQKFSDKSPLRWTASKSALIELLYALHLTHCFNGGSTDLTETVRIIEKTFNTDLGNFYKTLHEIKNRKTGRTKFLTALQERLEEYFDSELI